MEGGGLGGLDTQSQAQLAALFVRPRRPCLPQLSLDACFHLATCQLRPFLRPGAREAPLQEPLEVGISPAPPPSRRELVADIVAMINSVANFAHLQTGGVQQEFTDDVRVIPRGCSAFV